jgi:hypothetical protein
VKPSVVFPDAILAALEVLRAQVPGHVPGAAFGTAAPSVQRTGDLKAPYGMVALDAVFGQYPVHQSATIRVVAYGTTEAQTLALAQICRTVLLTHEGGGAARSFGELTGPIPSSDPDTGAPVAYFTVAARMRPTPL